MRKEDVASGWARETRADTAETGVLEETVSATTANLSSHKYDTSLI